MQYSRRGHTPNLYRPLRVKGLLIQLIVVVAAEVFLFHLYSINKSDVHWAIHFFVGLSAASLFNLTWLLLKSAPAPGQLLSILVFHLIAMFPDFLFRAHVPHEPWMNVFLGHIEVHYIPGGATSLLVIALILCGTYLATLLFWLSGRRARR